MDPSKKKEKPIKRSISKLFRDRAHSFAASGLPPAPSSPDGSFGRKASVGGHRSKSRASESFGSASSSSGVPLTPEDALIEAIRRGDVAQVKALLSQSVNVSHEDATGRQPLHFAVRRGNVSMITSLIQAGASVNAQTMVKMNDSLTKYKTKDQTPLHIACDTGNSEVVKLLLQHGADPTINDSTHCLPEQIATIKGNSLAAITVLSHRHLAKGTKRLELKRMSITNFDLGPLSLLAQLTTLDLSSNNLTRFPVKDLAALPLLTVLDLSNNSIYEVPETVSRLQGLTKLKLANNQLRFPPFELLHLTNAKKITLKGNPFIRFPKPIYTGETSELMRFLQNLENENEQYSKVKLMFLGDERCGKTSLLHQLRAGQPSDSQSIFQAQSVDVSKLPGLDDRVEFLAYDFPPDEINFPTHQFFFTARAIYVICIPADRPLKQVRLDYWIKLIQSASKGSKASIFLAVTKIDESSDEARLKQLVDELTSYKSRISENIEICLVNNMTGQGVMDLHQLITNAAIENPLFKKTYPPSWKTLVRRLSRVSKEGSQVLSRQQYLELSLDINVQGDNLLNALVSLQDAGLLTFLHDRDPSNRSGASLISPLPDYIVLDQTWLAKFFDNLVLHRRRIIVNGLISLSDINESWGHAKPHQRHIILEWMCSKEIAYRFRSNCILVPSLLRDRKPSLSSQLWTPNILPGFVEYRRVYSISVNTTNLFSRQLARLFHIPHSEVVFIWKTGLILSHPTNFQSNATDSLMGSTSSSLHPDRNQSEVTYTETSENDDLSISTTTDGSGDGSDNEEVDDFRSGSITPKNGSSSSSLALGAFLQASSSNLTQSCGAPSSNGSWNSASSPSSSSSSFASFSTSSSSSNDNSMKPNTMYALVQHNPLTNETTVNVRVPEDVLPWLLPSIIMHLDEQLWSFHLKQSEHQVLVPCSHCILKNPLAQPYQFTLEDCVEAITSGSFYIYCNRIQSYSRRVRVDSLAPDLALFCAQFLRGITCDRILSEGGFGLVFQGTYCGNQVAVKEMRIKPWGEGSSYNLSKFSAFQREVSILAIANHPNLIQLYGISFNPLRMVMEFLPDGDLYHLLNSSDSISLTYRLRICLDIAKGLRYLHKLTPPIVHRDIRSPNILIASRDENATIVAKVADFGLARQVAPTLNGSVGNWQWMAPEVIASDSSGYDERSDIYSFGVVMWEIFSRCAPFLEYESQERFMRSLGVDDKGEAIFAVRYQSIKQAVIEEELRPTIPDDTPLPVAEIIQKCWRHSPSDRPSFEAIVSSLSALLGRSYSEEQSPSPSFFPQPSTFVPSLQLPKSEDGTDSSEAPVPDASNGRQLIQILDQELPPPKIKIFHSNVRTLPIGDKALCSVYIRPNFWVGGSKGTLWLVDTKSLDVRRLDSTHTTRVYAITKVNKEAWVSSEIGKIFIYDTETFAGLGEIDAHQENMIRDLATYEDASGQTMVCSCSPIDQSIKIWCGDTRKLVKSISFNDFAISSIHLDGDSIWLGSQKDLVLFELSKLTTEKKCEPVVFLTGHSKKINIITTFPDTIWSGSDDNSICIWSKRKNEMIRKITAHTRPVKCLVKINQFVASGSPDCTIIVWDSENGLPVAELELEGEVLSISQAKRMLCVGVSRSIVLVPFKLL